MLTEQQLREKEYTKEDILLADCMTWAKNTYPQIRKAIFHIKNEGDSGSKFAKIKASQDLAKGKLKGVFDVQSVYMGHIVFIEFKLPHTNLSPAQLELAELWSGWSIPIFIVDNFDDFKYIIEKVILTGHLWYGGIYGKKYLRIKA